MLFYGAGASIFCCITRIARFAATNKVRIQAISPKIYIKAAICHFAQDSYIAFSKVTSGLQAKASSMDDIEILLNSTDPKTIKLAIIKLFGPPSKYEIIQMDFQDYFIIKELVGFIRKFARKMEIKVYKGKIWQ